MVFRMIHMECNAKHRLFSRPFEALRSVLDHHQAPLNSIASGTAFSSCPGTIPRQQTAVACVLGSEASIGKSAAKLSVLIIIQYSFLYINLYQIINHSMICVFCNV